MHVPMNRENPTSTFFTPSAAYMTGSAPLMAVGTLDSSGRPWTTIWGGKSGLAGPMGRLGTAKGNLMAVKTKVDKKYDPVVEILGGGEFQKSRDNGGILVGALPIDLERRTRVKIFGRELGGQVIEVEDESLSKEEKERVGEIQMLVDVEQSLGKSYSMDTFAFTNSRSGNCPKYLNSKHITPVVPNPRLFSTGANLSPEAIELVHHSDMFFMTTSNGKVDMDTNHRGGPPGFVRVLPGQPDEPSVLVYPEYSGNRLYQSLGNLVSHPEIGICIPDFDTGDVLYLTGIATILTEKDASALLPHSNLAIKIQVTESRFVLTGLPFRGDQGEFSPYNPPVRRLAVEGATDLDDGKTSENLTAELVNKEELSPTITRYRFKASKDVKYSPGQWVALDFSEELDQGYSHMRDDDPLSLNDDHIRTFTVSSHPEDSNLKRDEFEITARTNGPVTTFLRRQRVGRGGKLEVKILGFGGDFRILSQSLEAEKTVVPFIAGGVGITPILGELSPSTDVSNIRLLWTTPASDSAFVLGTLRRHTGLAKYTHVYFTSGKPAGLDVERLEEMGAVVVTRRLSKKDLMDVESEFEKSERKIDSWKMCASENLRREVVAWLGPDRKLEFESFEF
jgi:ferredoxin-NADP reductase